MKTTSDFKMIFEDRLIYEQTFYDISTSYHDIFTLSFLTYY